MTTDTPRETLAPAPAGNDQSPERIRGMFAAITPAYDRLNHLLSGQMDRRWRRIAADEAVRGLEPCRRLLDVATGTGDLANALSQVVERSQNLRPDIVGVDFTGPMLKQALKKYGTYGFRWIEGDGLHLPLPDAAFDACTIAFGLRNMVDRPRALAEMARVVRPGGRVVILEFSQPRNRLIRAGYDWYSYQVLPRVGAWLSGSRAYLYLADSIRDFWGAEELAEQMRRAGLTDVRYRPLMFGVVALHAAVRS